MVFDPVLFHANMEYNLCNFNYNSLQSKLFVSNASNNN